MRLSDFLITSILTPACAVYTSDWSEEKLEKAISPEIGRLNKLKLLNLGGLGLPGGIPAAIGNLEELTTLYLEENELEDEIPAQVGGCMSLKYLRLTKNKLTNKIPTTLGKCTMLEELHLGENCLAGGKKETQQPSLHYRVLVASLVVIISNSQKPFSFTSG